MVWYGRFFGAMTSGCAGSSGILEALFCSVNPHPSGIIPTKAQRHVDTYVYCNSQQTSIPSCLFRLNSWQKMRKALVICRARSRCTRTRAESHVIRVDEAACVASAVNNAEVDCVTVVCRCTFHRINRCSPTTSSTTSSRVYKCRCTREDILQAPAP